MRNGAADRRIGLLFVDTREKLVDGRIDVDFDFRADDERHGRKFQSKEKRLFARRLFGKRLWKRAHQINVLCKFERAGEKSEPRFDKAKPSIALVFREDERRRRRTRRR